MPRAPAGLVPDRTRTRRAIVKILKTEGPADAAQLASRLHVTAMAVRQHLYDLEREKLVAAEERPLPRGRPAKYWRLTREANRLFPDAYAELSLALIGALRVSFGEGGVAQVLESRAACQEAEYRKRIPRALALRAKLARLAHIRTEEGYMAEVKPGPAGSFLFVENHCPICAAATACQGFCATELGLFRAILGPGVTIDRVEHIPAGERRCVYRVSTPAR